MMAYIRWVLLLGNDGTSLVRDSCNFLTELLAE